MAYANSCVNPVVYAFMSKNFRAGCWKPVLKISLLREGRENLLFVLSSLVTKMERKKAEFSRRVSQSSGMRHFVTDAAASSGTCGRLAAHASGDVYRRRNGGKQKNDWRQNDDSGSRSDRISVRRVKKFARWWTGLDRPEWNWRETSVIRLDACDSDASMSSISMYRFDVDMTNRFGSSAPLSIFRLYRHEFNFKFHTIWLLW